MNIRTLTPLDGQCYLNKADLIKFLIDHKNIAKANSQPLLVEYLSNLIEAFAMMEPV